VSGVFKVIDEDFGHGGLETVVASDEKWLCSVLTSTVWILHNLFCDLVSTYIERFRFPFLHVLKYSIF
jgi:hypothetical protein